MTYAGSIPDYKQSEAPSMILRFQGEKGLMLSSNSFQAKPSDPQIYMRKVICKIKVIPFLKAGSPQITGGTVSS